MTALNYDVNLLADEIENNPVIIPAHVAQAAYRIGRQRAGYYPTGQCRPECELSIINQCCHNYGVTPSQEIYDEVYAELSGIDGGN